MTDHMLLSFCTFETPVCPQPSDWDHCGALLGHKFGPGAPGCPSPHNWYALGHAGCLCVSGEHKMKLKWVIKHKLYPVYITCCEYWQRIVSDLVWLMYIFFVLLWLCSTGCCTRVLGCISFFFLFFWPSPPPQGWSRFPGVLQALVRFPYIQPPIMLFFRNSVVWGGHKTNLNRSMSHLFNWSNYTPSPGLYISKLDHPQQWTGKGRLRNPHPGLYVRAMGWWYPGISS